MEQQRLEKVQRNEEKSEFTGEGEKKDKVVVIQWALAPSNRASPIRHRQRQQSLIHGTSEGIVHWK
jgi:hypothetical protein